jgi:hypothetical protein
MGVVGAVATTAVVAGTAGAVRHHQDQKWANQAAEQQAQQNAQQQAYDQQAQMEAMQQQMAQMQAQQAAAAAAAPAAAAAAPAAAAAAPAAAASGGSDLMTQLNQLTQLHQAGALTDDEYAAAKAKLLA